MSAKAGLAGLKIEEAVIGAMHSDEFQKMRGDAFLKASGR